MTIPEPLLKNKSDWAKECSDPRSICANKPKRCHNREIRPIIAYGQ